MCALYIYTHIQNELINIFSLKSHTYTISSYDINSFVFFFSSFCFIYTHIHVYIPFACTNTYTCIYTYRVLYNIIYYVAYKKQLLIVEYKIVSHIHINTYMYMYICIYICMILLFVF